MWDDDQEVVISGPAIRRPVTIFMQGLLTASDLGDTNSLACGEGHIGKFADVCAKSPGSP